MKLKQILNHRHVPAVSGLVDRSRTGLHIGFVESCPMGQQHRDRVQIPVPHRIIQGACAFSIPNIHFRALFDQKPNHVQMVGKHRER